MKNIKEKDTWTEKKYRANFSSRGSGSLPTLDTTRAKTMWKISAPQVLRFVDKMFQNSRILFICLVF